MEFRKLIAEDGENHEKLIHKNPNSFGIPQGAPISDLLANLYLFEFDREMQQYMASMGGIYWRYSDDIFMLVPGGLEHGQQALTSLTNRITNHDDKLRIKPEKSMWVAYWKDGDAHGFQSAAPGRGRNGIEYLGFRFDGKQVYIRDSTVARLYRKITYYCRKEARALVRRFPGKSVEELSERSDLSKFESRFGRVEDFDRADVRSWTFRTYAKRASRIFGPRGKPILRQIRQYREYFHRTLSREIESIKD